MFQYWKYYIVVSTIVVGFNGCTNFSSINEALKPRQIDTYNTSKAFEAMKAHWPSEFWWRSYQDEQLNNLIEIGLENSPNIAIVSARIKQAGAYMQGTKSQLLPHIGANASASSDKLSYNHVTPSYMVPQQWNDYGQASLSMSWEIDFWGKNRAALAAATSEFEAIQAEKKQAELIIASAIATSYAQLTQLYTLRDTINASLKIKQNILEHVGKKYTVGLENKSSVSDAKAKYTNTLGELQAIDEQIALTKNQIAALLGEGPDKGLEIHRPHINIENKYELPHELALDLLGRRPDIVSAKLQVEAKDSKIKQKKAAFYPNINLSAMIGLQSLGLDNLTKSGSDIGSVGPAIYLPIFTGGRLEADLKSSEASYDEAVANYNNTVVHALQDVADTGVSQKSLSLQIKTAQEGLDAAQTSYDVTNNRYKQGVSNYIEVLYASDNVYTAQKYLVMLKTKSLILDIAMKRALGGGYIVEKNN